jgi:hypothetical protein
MSTVKILKGTYRNQPVNDVSFTLVKGFQTGAKGGYVTVDSNGYFGPEFTNVRIRVNDIADVEFVGGAPVDATTAAPVAPHHETDEEVIERIGRRFSILDDMTRAAIAGDIRAMIVVGPPGVGKSYGVEAQLDRAGLFDSISAKRPRYEVIKGAMTPIGLYATLYKYSDPRNVLVFDDCDSILLDDIALNILKAALDSGKKRKIHWNSDSSLLRREGVPNYFEFKGSVIFITNLKFDNLKSKKLQDHLDALQSRCHFLDLTLNTMRDKFLRIKQIHLQGELFRDYNFEKNEPEEIMDFMYVNRERLREMSLRMALKIADLIKVSDNWKMLAENTCMKHA